MDDPASVELSIDLVTRLNPLAEEKILLDSEWSERLL
jgi:hypothetical protein